MNSVSRETRLSSRKASAIKGAATRKRQNDARYERLLQAVRKLTLSARLAETKLRFRISDKDRVRLRADLLEGLKAVDDVLPPPDQTEPI